MEPKEIVIKEIIIAGISIKTCNENEMKPEKAEIPVLWNNFFEKNIRQNIPNQIENSPIYGVYSDYESDVNGYYRLTVGMSIKDNSTLSVVKIESGKYLTFESKKVKCHK